MFLRTCLALALFCLLAVACVPAPAPPHFPEITFPTEAPFRIAAKTVEIVEAYVKADFKAPWYIDLLNINIDNVDLEAARKRIALYMDAFARDGTRITENMDFD